MKNFEENAQLFVNKLNDFFSKYSKVSALNDVDGFQLDGLVDEKKDLLSVYKKGPLFTKLINLKVLPYIVKNCLGEENLTIEHEYYRIDVIAYENKKKNVKLIQDGKDLGLTPYCWDFRYAIEHENAHGKWIDEAVKLAYINCPMRIIIGYNRKLKKGEELKKFDEKCLKYMIECINSSNINVNKQDNTKLLILFGVRNDKQEWEKITYNGYVVDYKTKEIRNI